MMSKRFIEFLSSIFSRAGGKTIFSQAGGFSRAGGKTIFSWAGGFSRVGDKTVFSWARGFSQAGARTHGSWIQTITHQIGGSLKLLRESTNANQKRLKIAFLTANCRFRLSICNLKHCFNAYRSALLESRDSSRLPPIRCVPTGLTDMACSGKAVA